MDETNLIAKLFGGGTGFLAGIIAGVATMLYQKSRNDKQFDEMKDRLMQMEKTHMPRSEIITLYKEHRDEAREMNQRVNEKLDTVIVKLGDIAVAMAGKADKP
jgi:hypothetical protein